MARPLPFAASITGPPHDYLRSIGDIFAVFDASTQDSGNVSYGVHVDDDRYFVKTAGSPDATACLPHAERVALLHNAIEIARDCAHPATAELLHVIDPSPHGPLLVYEWIDGELLHAGRVERGDPESGYRRFLSLPVDEIVAALDTVFDFHRVLASRGWIAVDFYDASLIYNFERRRMRVVDIDMYHCGEFTNTVGRMFGSSRFMAPEEHTLGAAIGRRANVFTLGRTMSVFLSDGTLDRSIFRAGDRLFAVMKRACRINPHERYADVADFYDAWQASLKTA